MVAQQQASAPRRITLVEDHAVFAQTLSLVLSGRGHVVEHVAPEAALTQVLRQVVPYPPDVALVDLDLGAAGSGVDLLVPLVSAGIAVLVVTGSQDRVRWGECLALGARGVLGKSGALEDLLDAVDRVLAGRPVHDEAERTALVDGWLSRRDRTADLAERFDRLTPREAAVLGQLMLGRTVNEIARASVVSPATVRTQVKAVLAKLQVSSQLGAVGAAHEAGWTPPRTART